MFDYNTDFPYFFGFPPISSFAKYTGHFEQFVGCSPLQLAHMAGVSLDVHSFVRWSCAHLRHLGFRLQLEAAWPYIWHLWHCIIFFLFTCLFHCTFTFIRVWIFCIVSIVCDVSVITKYRVWYGLLILYISFVLTFNLFSSTLISGIDEGRFFSNPRNTNAWVFVLFLYMCDMVCLFLVVLL